MSVLLGAPPHHVEAREAFTKAILDAIGYELPKDEEREAFERWLNDNPKQAGNDDPFDAWKAGRDELRRATAVSASAANPDAKPKKPTWIPWSGGECPLPDTVKRWEVMFRDECKYIPPGKPSEHCWQHWGRPADFIAYRVWG